MGGRAAAAELTAHEIVGEDDSGIKTNGRTRNRRENLANLLFSASTVSQLNPLQSFIDQKRPIVLKFLVPELLANERLSAIRSPTLFYRTVSIRRNLLALSD